MAKCLELITGLKAFIMTAVSWKTKSIQPISTTEIKMSHTNILKSQMKHYFFLLVNFIYMFLSLEELKQMLFVNTATHSYHFF